MKPSVKPAVMADDPCRLAPIGFFHG
jgi:hypothetical protein